jgi:hypothetical protein
LLLVSWMVMMAWNLDDVKAVRLLEILLSEHHFVTRMLPVCYRVITTICYG